MASNKSQAIVDALPDTGTVTYRELRQALVTAGRGESLRDFHEARRSGAFESRLIDGELHVARVGNLPPRQADAGNG